MNRWAASLVFVLFLGALVLALSAAFSQLQWVGAGIGNTGAVAPATSTPIPTPGIPLANAWQLYESPDYNVSLQYPPYWERDLRYGLRFGGADGFFQLSAANAETIDSAAAAEANHKLRPYGAKPTTATIQVQGQDARLILPSDGQAQEMRGQAALIVAYAEPAQMGGSSYKYLLLWADKDHIGAIASTLRFGASGPMGQTVTPVPPIGVRPGPTPEVAVGIFEVARLAVPGIPAPDQGYWPFDWSPKAQALAYATQDGVYVARAPAFSALRIARQRGSTPLWSPDGKFVAFAGYRGEGEQAIGTLWLAAADGSVVRDLLAGEKAKLSVSTAKRVVAWVDERTLSFAEGMGTGVAALATVDVQSGEVELLAGHPGATYVQVAGTSYVWSPNRALLAVENWGRGLPSTSFVGLAKGLPIALDSADGDRAVSFRQFRDWAPDSRALLYAQWPAGAKPWPIVDQAPDLYRRSVDVNAVRGELLIPRAYQARWSPDGKRIAFLLLGTYSGDEQGRIRSSDFRPGQPFPVYLGIHDVAAGKPIALIPIAKALHFDNPNDAMRWFETRAPRWAPDGSALAYLDEGGNAWMSTGDGGGQWQVAQGGPAGAMGWSADGKLLALQLGDEIRIVAKPG